MGLSMSPSPKSPMTSLASDPQMPARRGLVTTQSGPTMWASSTVCSPKGSESRNRSRSSVASGRVSSGPGGEPKTSAFIDCRPVRRRLLGRRLLGPVEGHHAGHEGVDVGHLGLDHRLHVGQEVLEVLVVDGVGDAPGRLLGRDQVALVERRVVVGLVPQLGVDGPGQDELHRHAGAGHVGGDALAPAAHGELRRRVARLGGDPEATGDAGHVHDDPGGAGQHAGDQGQGHGRGGQEVDAHDALHVRRCDVRDGLAHGHAGVVDQDVDVRRRRPRPSRASSAAASGSERSAAHICEAGSVDLAVSQNFGQPVVAAGHDAHRHPPLGQLAGQGGADAGGGAR